MPIYEYKGQQYDIATDDHAAAKEKILKYLDSQGKPAAAPAAPAEDVPTTDPMGSDFASAISNAPTPKQQKTYTGSVFDTQPFPEVPFNPAEAEQLSNRAYAQKTTQFPRKAPPELTPTPESATGPRTARETATDIYAGIWQGGIGAFKSILDNIPGNILPGSEALEGATQYLEGAKSPRLRGSQIAREGAIGRAREVGGDLAATRAAYQTMFTPAGVDVIAQGAGSILPAIGMSLGNLGLKSFEAFNLLSNAGDAAVQSAEQLKQISPEQWSKSQVYQNLRSAGLSHRDAVNMLAPIYALPAQITGGGTGYISGRTGLEKRLTQGAEKGVRAAAGRFGAEFAGEELESLAPQFIGNLVASTIDQNISPTDGLGRTAVETAFGTLPGAILAATPSKAGKRLTVLNDTAQRNGFTDVQDMIRKLVPTIGRKAVEDQLIDALDKESDEQDAQTQQQTKGAPSVTTPIPPTSGAGVRVAGQPSEDTTPAGVGEPIESGVVPTGQNVTGAPAGEAVEPTSVDEDGQLTWKGEPQQAAAPTPLHKYIIDRTVDKFYDTFINADFGDIPENLRTTKLYLNDINNGIESFREWLSGWDHPAIAGETESEKRTGKAKATAEERELLDIESSLAGLGHRITNQAMAIAKGYKGKKAGSEEKIDAAYDEATKLFNRGIELANKRGLLPADVAELYEDEQRRLNAEKKAAETPVEPEVPVKDELPPLQTEEPPQQAPVDKPAPITDVREPESPADSTTPAPVEDKPYFGSEEINALGDRIKNAIDKITNDFMVGDMVRYGTTQGTVVGADDTHVKIHPDGAASPKAYYRVPKARVELIARPDTTSKTAAMASPGEDKKFGIEQGKLGADMPGLVQLLGANMYGTAIAEVAVKELLQNSFDAVKGAVSNKKSPSLYKHGEITITFDGSNRTITIQDNARGMTPEIIRDALFTIAGSDKSDLAPEERSGGLGLAKMGFMMGAEKLTVDTVRDGVRVRVDTTATDIVNSKFQIVKTSANKKEHGTTVTVKIPEFYVDPKTGEKKSIYFSGSPTYYSALQKPLIGPVVVKTIEKNTFKNKEETLQAGLNFPADKYIPFKVNFSWGSADIYFSKERNSSEYDWEVHHQVLSSGVFQFDTNFKISQNEKIPYDIIVNIKSSVEAKHPDYPFENSRERFKSRLDEDIKSLSNYLAQIARGNQMEDLQENFKNIVSMPRVDIGQDVADASEANKKLHKAFDQRGATERRELPPMPKEVRIEGTKVISTDTGKVVADRQKQEEKKTKGSFTAETEAPKKEDFLLTMQQSPKLPIFHNNTNVDFLAVGKQYGNPERFFAELGTLMVEMKETLGNSGLYGYDVLKPENLFFGGVSIDKGYGGVHIKVPYQAVLINPFYDFGAKTLFGAREYLWETMTHEMAHTGDMGHGVGHNTQMLKVRQYLADQGLADYFRDAIMDLLTTHESTFTAMREAYGKSTTKNTAKSLKDYEKGSASTSDGGIASRSENQLRALPARGQQGGDGNIRTAPPINPTSGIPRATGITSPDSVKGLHQDVVDAINRNDISGALRAISRNTSGLYSELASRLADLNLPTSVIFNNERELVRQIIDDRSGQQQIRVFAYLSRVAPEFYEKYFKDYDKSENLERVAEGLSKLASSGVNTDPIKTELATVQRAYEKNIPGLTAPGFFASNIDAINIRPDARFGTSNRVLMHEFVHAATEFMLHGMPGLTQEQQEAVGDLYEMYEHAQKMLPPGEYGFTNISEFIAEVMTNPKFQAKLKGIPYKPQKTSVLNSLLRFITSMFGLNNLAGASMAAVNEIFSAQRPANMKAAPLRFATAGPRKKRVRGPISKPDTWRTAESVQNNIRDVVSDAATGRVSIGSALKDLSGALWDASGTGVRAVMLPVLQLRQLKDLTRNKFPQIGGAVNIVEKMVSYRGQRIKIAENVVQKWSALQSKYPKQSSLMGRIMLEATIRARDPDKGLAAGAAPDALDNAWNALRPEFQQLYREVRDFYATGVQEMIRTMKERALGLPKAERQAMIRKINEQFGPDKLIAPYFPLRRFGPNWFQVGKGDHKEFYTFSNAIQRSLAFNKRRRDLQNGNALQKAAADTMRMGNGISELYSQNIATTQVLRDVEDTLNSLTATDVAGVKAEIKDSLNQLIYLLLPQQSMRKMFINRKAIQGASGDMLRVFAHTAVHSAYQQARFKYAEPFINNIKNAREHIDDMEGAKAISPEQGAVYKDYVLELERRTKNIMGIEDKSPVAQSVGAVTGTTFFFMLSSPASALLNILGMAQITMPYIGGRYGYAKTNALMLKYAALYGASLPGRTLGPAVTGNFMQVSFPSIVEGGMLAKLNPILQQAANRFIDDGDINISMTNDIFDLGERPSALYTGVTNNVKKTLAGLFHQAERLNREIALLTTFELAYEKSLKEPRKDIRGVIERDRTGQPVNRTQDEAFELAIQEARDIAGLTLGDFTRQMKGRIFTAPAINFITQFKQYAITATYNVLRNFYLSVGAPWRTAEIEQFRQQMIKDGVTPAIIDQRISEAEQQRKEVYREGMKRLAGILGMTFLFGGLAAQPFFSMLGKLISMFAPPDDFDDFSDWENWFSNYMESNVGGSAAALFKSMGMEVGKADKRGVAFGEALARGPLSVVTGTALSDRVSLDLKNLWWREGRYSPDARQSLQEDIIANIGPSLGLGLNWADAWQLAGQGQWGKAFEKAAPAMFSRPVTAYRLGTEGATDRTGNVIGGLYPQEFTTWQLAMQAIGLQPEKLAQAQKAAIQAKTYQQKVEDRRKAILDRIWMERGKPGYMDAIEKAQDFSLMYPERAIDGDTISKEFESRGESKAKAEAMGAKLDEKLYNRTGPMLNYGMQ